MTPDIPKNIRFGRATCCDLNQAESREWWLSNGLGAYAAGTLAGSLTRRYHGLLIAPLHSLRERILVFAKADAELSDGERTWPLHANHWLGGGVNPEGQVHIESFQLEGRLPVWRFAIGGIRLEQRIWMEADAHATYIAWRLLPNALDPPTRLQLRIRLLVNARDHHGNARPWEFNPVIEGGDHHLRIRQPNGPVLHLQARGGRIESDHTWYENFDLPVERDRGLPAHDAHLCAGLALLEPDAGEWVGLVASLDTEASLYLGEALRRAQAYDLGLLIQSRARVPELSDAPEWIDQLLLAADSFVLRRPLPDLPEGRSVIAGFPWFDEWGRDAMIALPGLTLATGRCEDARRILETWVRFFDRGMLPNTLGATADTSSYNAADAALWFIEACRAYLEVVDDRAFLKTVSPVVEDIIRHYGQGTRFGIVMDEADGLLRAGEPGVQVTWMDAKVGDWVVTPRIGKPVEINALWYNALCAASGFAKRLDSDSDAHEQMAAKTQAGFQRFLNPAHGGLYDVLDGPSGHDASIRPNQIFAVSLPYSPLEADTQSAVVRLCRRALLTSHGLRSLDPAHEAYRPRYAGDVTARDGAYHQGTAWAWLLGHYARAEYRAHGDAEAALALLEPIRDHLLDGGLGTVSEIFDGDPPHVARGCPAQAWSVACILEAWWRLERARRRTNRNEAKEAAAARIDRPRLPRMREVKR